MKIASKAEYENLTVTKSLKNNGQKIFEKNGLKIFEI